MALQKLITLSNGICGSYIRVADSYEMNRREESVTAHVTLFFDAGHAQARPDMPLAVIALVQLTDAEFDSYLGRDALVTAGGRVLNITALGETPAAARAAAYAGVELVEFDGKQTRSDIALRAEEATE